jgi:FkbM family methyltransferase
MIIFDIGANNGKDCFHFSNNPNNVVYAFEPTPHLLETFLNKMSKDNYIVIPKGVGEKEGKYKFYIAGQADWGCSSLYKFSDNLNKQDGWAHRDDFKVTQEIEIDLIRIDSFVDENNITSIDYVHCDTQGNDLSVLRSFGKYIDIVKRGRVEVWIKNPLYKNTDNQYEKIKEFLESKGFKTHLSIHSNGNEADLHFRKVVR